MNPKLEKVREGSKRFEKVLALVPVPVSGDSKRSTRREELGRPTPGVFGGFSTTFFYQRRFGFTHEILLVIDKLQKLPSRSL